MTTSVVLYINKKSSSINIIMLSIKKSINEFISESYVRHDIQEREKGKLTFIKSQAKLSEFHYTPNDYGATFAALFAVFLDEDDKFGQAKKKFDREKDKIETNNWYRTMNIMENNNADIATHIILENDDDYMSLIMGDDYMSRSIMNKIAQDLMQKQKIDIYYTDDEIETVKKINPLKEDKTATA